MHLRESVLDTIKIYISRSGDDLQNREQIFSLGQLPCIFKDFSLPSYKFKVLVTMFCPLRVILHVHLLN